MGQKVLVLNSDIIQASVIDTQPSTFIFLFNKQDRAPHGESLSFIKSRSNKSCNCNFNSFNSVGIILYGIIEIGATPGVTSILKAISFSGGKDSNYSRKISGYSFITGKSSNLTLLLGIFIRKAKYP